MNTDLWGYVVSWLVENLGFMVKVVEALIAVGISYYVARYISSRVAKLKLKAPPEIVFNIARAAKWLIVLVGVLIALSIMGVELGGLLVAAGFTGIVVGLALQQTLSQFFSGISLLLEGRVKVGDAIMVGDSGGVVEHIGLMSTQIRMWSGEVLTLPNNYVASSNIRNFTRSVARRVDFTVGISYDSDIDKALNVIKSVLDRNELILAEPPPTLLVDALSDSSLDIKVMFWVPAQHFWSVRSDSIKEIKKALDNAGIEIPFPQRVVWLRQTKTP